MLQLPKPNQNGQRIHHEGGSVETGDTFHLLSGQRTTRMCFIRELLIKVLLEYLAIKKCVVIFDSNRIGTHAVINSYN